MQKRVVNRHNLPLEGVQEFHDVVRLRRLVGIAPLFTVDAIV
jgi:hypothetical protein